MVQMLSFIILSGTEPRRGYLYNLITFQFFWSILFFFLILFMNLNHFKLRIPKKYLQYNVKFMISFIKRLTKNTVNWLYEASTTIIPEPVKDITKEVPTSLIPPWTGTMWTSHLRVTWPYKLPQKNIWQNPTYTHDKILSN